MTPGAHMDSGKTFAALRPAALDEITEDAYARRRDTDLAQAMRGTERTTGRTTGQAAGARSRRRPTLLLAGVATACAVAAVAAVVATGQDAGPVTRVTQAPDAPPDARTLLLASAQTAERVPVEPGRYWYTRERTRTLHDTRVEPRRPGAGGRRPKEVTLPYAYCLAGTQESWLSRTGRDRTRTITAIDVEASFPTRRDEAGWRRAGSPNLIDEEDRRPSVNDDDMPVSHQIGNHRVRTEDLPKLPADARRLGAELRRRYEADVKEAGGPQNVDPYPYYVWMTAQDLLAGPITPATKAALYRVLADQPGVRSEGAMSDQLGRRGVAVAMDPVADGMPVRLIIDPRTARLLAYESGARNGQGIPRLSVAYEAMGWVNGLRDRL